MKEYKKDGIIFVEDSSVVDLLDFGCKHLDCAVVFYDYNDETYSARIFAYADSSEYNDKLSMLFDSDFRERGYKYFEGVSSNMVDNID